ncbi:hypothetical protein RvY_03815 [Ramazzottius varieornatus]|uniref:Uncharacterized protein n=1 Tax=Ramazzottius varieornatus TaxID=947166 RepID=A0A1D1UZJ6_RAMVA|nr:hypothetical protein RvY_03815 [Ramazzottius varieornatus]
MAISARALKVERNPSKVMAALLKKQTYDAIAVMLKTAQDIRILFKNFTLIGLGISRDFEDCPGFQLSEICCHQACIPEILGREILEFRDFEPYEVNVTIRAMLRYGVAAHVAFDNGSNRSQTPYRKKDQLVPNDNNSTNNMK